MAKKRPPGYGSRAKVKMVMKNAAVPSMLTADDTWVPQDSADRKVDSYLHQLLSERTLPIDRTEALQEQQVRDVIGRPDLYPLSLREWAALAKRLSMRFIAAYFHQPALAATSQQQYSRLLANLQARGGKYAARATFLSACTEGSRADRRASFDDLEQHFHEDEAYWFERGFNEFRSGRFKAADEHLKRAETLALNDQPQLGRATMYRARIARWLGETAREVELLQHILEGPCEEKEPLDEAIRYLGPALLRLGRADEALKFAEVWTHFPHGQVVEMCAVHAGALALQGHTDAAQAYAREIGKRLATGDILVGPLGDSTPTRRPDGQPDNRGSQVLSAALSYSGQAFTAQDLLQEAIENESQRALDGHGVNPVKDQLKRARDRARQLNQPEMAEEFGMRLAKLALRDSDRSALVGAQDDLMAHSRADEKLSRLLRESTHRFPDEAEFHLQLGLYALQRGHWAPAQEALSAAVARGSSYAGVLLAIAESELLDKNESTRVQQAVGAFIWHDQDERLPGYMLLPVLEWAERHGHYSSGVQWAERWRPVMYLEPGDHQAYLAVELAGRCALAAGDYDQSRFWIGQALEFRITNSNFGWDAALPLSETARLNSLAALAAHLTGHPADARDYLSTAERQNPSDPFALSVRAYFEAVEGNHDAAYASITRVAAPNVAWLSMAQRLEKLFSAASREDLAERLKRRAALERDAVTALSQLEEQLNVTSTQLLDDQARARRLERMNALMMNRIFAATAVSDPASEKLKRLLSVGDEEQFDTELQLLLGTISTQQNQAAERRIQEALASCWAKLPQVVRDRLVAAEKTEALIEQQGDADYGIPLICVATALEQCIRFAVMEPAVAKTRRASSGSSSRVHLTLGSAAYLFPVAEDPKLHQALQQMMARLPSRTQNYLGGEWSRDVNVVAKLRNEWAHGKRAIRREEYLNMLRKTIGLDSGLGLFNVAVDFII
ncbi:hypothetical protein [Deinococcus petrolearius]|uniref:Uncharacterized protein n=1 Tax=Deinococcus petrolearius TaxID=1751295 RepID=A0ABW1DR84_9DEIO